MEAVRIFIGYDPRESVAYHVLAHSLLRQASGPLSITPLSLTSVAHCFQRPRDARQSTDFAFSRFLVPYLCGYSGWALFMDCDMLARSDVRELWELRDDRFAVMVVKHDYTPRDATKFGGNVQTAYPRKNWSSVMLLNTARCRALEPSFVATASGLDLHRFNWLQDDEVGQLPTTWNHLVGEYPDNPHAKLVHFTLGGPYFAAYRGCEFSDLWFREWALAKTGLEPAGADAP
ncbi:MAG: hypothetical protein KC766_31980 [Myxococcales bacterium]|nr:hypothetical protein [Myxococcales bacterium]